MKQPRIMSNNRTNWSSKQETISQPIGVDYTELSKKVNKGKEAQNVIRNDLRKKSALNDNYSYEINKNDEVNKLDKNSIIPIPGVLFDDLENNDGYSGKSGHWNDVTNNQLTNGPQWNPMTF